MVDVHSHIIFGVDDGPSTIEESLKMLSEASNSGIKIIIATPHFHREIFENDNVLANFNKFTKAASNFDIKILLGYEVFINPILPKILAYNKELTLNNSGYLLLELPFDSIPAYIFDMIFQLQLLGITIIIAHPERSRNILKNFDSLIGLVERGCLLQIDAASIIGIYGRKIKEFTKKLINMKLVHFVASDAHCAKDYAEWYLKAYTTVYKWAGKDYTNELFEKNAESILNKIKESAVVNI